MPNNFIGQVRELQKGSADFVSLLLVERLEQGCFELEYWFTLQREKVRLSYQSKGQAHSIASYFPLARFSQKAISKEYAIEFIEEEKKDD